jgi:MFS transporter, DHA2 family, multidrug resistance protein
VTTEAAPADNKWLASAAVLTGTMMAVIDSSIVNVALPDMSGTLGATIEQITWVVTGYILSNVIFMPITALLSARFGRKRFYLASLILFTTCSALCGLARSLAVMVAFRVLQGVGGGVMIIVAQAILLETFPVEQRGLAMGLFGMGIMVAPAFGPTLGGWITDNYSWPWIFYINVPIGVVAVILVSRFIHDPAYLERDEGKIDWAGLGLLTVGLGSLQVMLEKGEGKNWFESELIVWLTVVAVLGLVSFVWRELKAAHAAVDLRIFRDASFSSATAIGSVLGLGLYGTLFVLPLFLQQLMGYTALESGWVLMPRSLAMALCMPIAGRLYNRMGPKILVAAGLVVSAFSFWELAHLTTQVGFWDVFMPQVWQGVGFSFVFVALSTAAVATIAKPKMTAATGLYNVVRRIFGSVGVAIAATELTSGTARYRADIVQHVSLLQPATRHFLAATGAAMQAEGSSAFVARERALDLLNLNVMRQAAVLAYNHLFFLATAVFAVCLPLVPLLKDRERGAAEVLAE